MGRNGNAMYARYGKRILDILVGIVAMPFLGILLIFVAPAIKREDGGPVFYNAERVGKNGKPFRMYKLRSMHVNAPDLVMKDGTTFNSPDDPRMTRVGAFLRRTSLDEMPQFLNVLKGDMSVVGPRPDLAREAAMYRGDEAERLLVRPGITGYAAVYGRNSLPWRERLALDVYYVRNLSFSLDAKVFFKTFATIGSQDGIYNDPEEPSLAENADSDALEQE